MLLLLTGSGEDDARNFAESIVLAHGGENIEPTEMRHHQVEQNEPNVAFSLQGLERFAAVVRQCDAKRPLLEFHFDDAPDMRLVVCDEHVVRLGGTSHERSNQGGDVVSIAPKLAEELADICAGRHENDQDGLVRENGNDRETRAVFEHRRLDVASMSGRTELVRRSDDRWDASRDIFRVESGGNLAVDQEAVVAQHDCGVHTFPLANGRHQVSNVRHYRFPSKVVAKLGLRNAEVKRLQSLELCQTRPYCSPLSPENMNPDIRRPTSKLIALAAAALSVIGVACGDFTGVPASLPTLTDSGTVYALNGAPPGAPTALHVFSGTLLPATAAFVFDVAFDIDAAGHVLIIPQRVVATGLSSSHTVGLQSVSGDFDAVASAPKSGYRADTTVVTVPGQVVLIQSSDPSACGISLTGSTLYGKVVVTAVDRVQKTLSLRYAVDPNCGFLSFAPGVPKD